MSLASETQPNLISYHSEEESYNSVIASTGQMSAAHSSPLPSCFRPTITDDHQPTAAPPPPPSDSTNLTTCLYYTHIGVFSLTWSRTLFGRSLHLQLQDNHHHNNNHQIAAAAASQLSPSSSSTLSFHLHIKPLLFWKKHGSKKLVNDTTAAQIYWDLSRAKFGSGSEPGSGFYIAVVVDGETALLVGDMVAEAYSKTKSQKPKRSQILFSRREHVFGNRVYSTTARVGGETRDITIECNVNGDGRLSFGIDGKKVMTVKRLKWKFRGNERVEIDGGVPINISWDVYNWMNFPDSSSKDGGPGVFMLKFEKLGFEEDECYNELESFNSFGMNDVELRKMRKSMLKSGRSSSASSSFSSSASSGSGSSSVMEWASSEENKLCGPIGFSLVVYAWNR